jgi:hypothetical protein
MLYCSYFNFFNFYLLLMRNTIFLYAHELGYKLTILPSTFVTYILSISHHAW